MYNDTHHLTIGIMDFQSKSCVPLGTWENVHVSERIYVGVAIASALHTCRVLRILRMTIAIA